MSRRDELFDRLFGPRRLRVVHEESDERAVWLVVRDGRSPVSLAFWLVGVLLLTLPSWHPALRAGGIAVGVPLVTLVLVSLLAPRREAARVQLDARGVTRAVVADLPSRAGALDGHAREAVTVPWTDIARVDLADERIRIERRLGGWVELPALPATDTRFVLQRIRDQHAAVEAAATRPADAEAARAELASLIGRRTPEG